MASEKGKADFSNVKAGVSSTAPSPPPKADFSNVKAAVTSTAPVVPPPASAERTYTVKKGDSLSKIAKAELGSANKWKAIWELNKDQIKNPDLIKPGQVLKLP
jgi:nucleoid-associated protein YgaU